MASPQDLLNNLFKASTGRDLNQAEVNWLNGQSDKSKAVNDYVNGLNVLSQNLLSDAQNIYGLKNFTLDDANKLRDSLYVAGDQRSHDTFYDRANAALQQKTVQEQLNPTVTPEQQNKNTGTVSDIFQSTLGRPPTQYELDHFSKQLAQGDDPLILQQTLQQSGEYLDKKAAQFRDQQSQQLQGFQDQAFAKAQPQIISSFMRAGRLNSSGLQSALANAQAELTQQNNQYLAGLSREDFLNSQGQAQNVFAQNTLPSVQRAQALTDLKYQLPFQGSNDVLARGNELQDYYRQQNDFNRYLQAQKDQSRVNGQYQLYGAGLSALLQGGVHFIPGYK
jgi:hypothetical protein